MFANNPLPQQRRLQKNEVLERSGTLTGHVNGCYKIGIDQLTGDLYYRDINNIWQPIPGGGGGGSERFGFPGEDVTAGENRTFNLSSHNLQISGGNIGFGAAPTTFFNVQDGSGNDLISIDKTHYQSLFGATDGNSFSSFVLNSDLIGNNVQFYISSTDNTNLVQITGDALTKTINLGADNGIMINSAYTLPLADGTANQVIKTNGGGILTWQDESGGGGGVSASNGLSIDGGSGDVVLGGDGGTPSILLSTRFIDSSGGDFGLSISGGVSNLGAMLSISGGSRGILASGSVYGLIASSNTIPLWASNSGGSGGSVDLGLLLDQFTRTGSNGNGVQIRMSGSLDSSAGTTIGNIKGILSNAAAATPIGQFEFELRNEGDGITRKFAILGSGQLIGDKYGQGTFTGTPAYTLQVDSSGHIIEGSPSGGGNTIYTADDSITDDRTIGLASHNIVFVDSITSVGVLIDPDTVVLGDLTRANTYLLTDVLNKTISLTAADGTAIAAVTLLGDSAGGVVFGLNANSATTGCGITGNAATGDISYSAGSGAKHEFDGKIQFDSLNPYTNNAAAISAGLTAGQLYYTNVAGDGILKIVI